MTYSSPIMKGEEIYRLIPQRAPIIMVDKLYHADEYGAVTGLDIEKENLFCDSDRLAEAGVIEHIAQSAAAFAGFPYYINGEAPKLGYIGEIKKFQLYRLPKCGESVQTVISVKGNAAGVTLINAETTAHDDKIACCDMKIFLKTK